MEFSNGLSFSNYLFTGYIDKYPLELGNKKNGRLFLNLGEPPIDVHFKEHEYALWTTKPSNGLFDICIKILSN